MANDQKSDTGATSVDDIAAMIVSKPVESEEVVEDELPTDGEIDDTSDDEVDESSEDEAETSDIEDETAEGDDDQPDDDEEVDEEPEYLDISDDDLITVVVDGQEQEISIGDLKKVHSLGGATEKRLQEATETRKAAHAERTQMLEALAEQERVLSQALTDLDDNVFQPVISAPPAELRQTNPDQYLRHQEAYTADQQRIASAKEAVQKKVEAIQGQRQERLKAYAEQAGQLIVQEIPELADEKQAPEMLGRLTDTAKSYGYTDQEIQSALDPRMFMLVRDAMRYREMTAKNKERPNVSKLTQNTKQVRRLRSGSTSTAKARARQKDTDRKKILDRARQTGKVDDVAAAILAPSRVK
jgi:hypothetical protein